MALLLSFFIMKKSTSFDGNIHLKRLFISTLVIAFIMQMISTVLIKREQATGDMIIAYDTSVTSTVLYLLVIVIMGVVVYKQT